MKVVSTVQELREAVGLKTGPVGLVPTMGALHAGHEQLLRAARLQNDAVVASIFVNPLQFDREDDFDHYPRTTESDLALCREQGVDIVFQPSAEELYPRSQLTFVDVPSLSNSLCGAFRPGHFRGVCTVVLKLLNIVAPKRAYFGQKDAQQLAVIRRMALDLNLPVEIVSVPTVRERDGLALSSRNGKLSPEERAIAPRLYETLVSVANALDSGERAVATLRDQAGASLTGIRLEYLEFVDPDTLNALELIADRVLIAGAIWLGDTRLIDNITWQSKAGSAA